MLKALKNKIAVVTGASRGIGKAITLGLASQEATLCLVGRDSKTLEEAAQSAKALTPLARPYEADLTLDDHILNLAEGLRRDFGGVDVLVHCAGAYSMGRLESATIQDLDLLYRSNVRAPYLLTQSLLPLIRSRQGQIVFINSTVGLTARAGVGQFSATQHALKAIADSLREEVNADGIRVVSVYTGRTATPRMEKIFQMEGKEYHPELLLQPEDVATAVIGALALPRTAEVTNISLRPLTKSY